MPSEGRAFVVMPFGVKDGPKGIKIDFNAVYLEYRNRRSPPPA